MEDNPPLGLDQKYVILYQGQHPIGVLLLQIIKVKLNESLRFKDKNELTRWGRITNRVKKFFAGFISIDTLICGNVLLTGEYGFFIHDHASKDQFDLIESAMKVVCKNLSMKGRKIGPVLMKDYYTQNSFANMGVNSTGFSEFGVQPNMIFDIREEWNTFDDYMASMKSKYRVRVRRAHKKLTEVQKRELDLTEITRLNQRIFDLYKDTADEAGFNLFTLPQNYFIKLKEYLDEKVKIVGYFIGDVLIGYYTIIYNKKYMEAHYLGYDKAYNHDKQTYLNMLYDLIREGIDIQAPKIQLARTAMEIKSSVGAEPHEMLCYLKHNNSLLNKLIAPGLKVFSPDDSWVARSPFKEK